MKLGEFCGLVSEQFNLSMQGEKCPKCGSENTEYCLWHKDTVCKKCGHYF